MIDMELLKAICGSIAIAVFVALIIGAVLMVFILLNSSEPENDDEQDPIDTTPYDEDIYR